MVILTVRSSNHLRVHRSISRGSQKELSYDQIMYLANSILMLYSGLVNLSIELKGWVAIVPKVYRMELLHSIYHSEDDPFAFYYRPVD